MYLEISELVGKTLTKIEKTDDEITFVTTVGGYVMFHDQDCCESVYVEDVTGDLSDLLNTPILIAEERTGDDEPKDSYDESYTWTYYTFRTIKGTVTIRWYGTSNGYYSEKVDFKKLWEISK